MLRLIPVMRVLIGCFLLLIVSACAERVPQEAARSADEALVADVDRRAAAEPETACAAFGAAWRVSVEAGLDRAATAVDARGRDHGCLTGGFDRRARMLRGAFDALAANAEAFSWRTARLSALWSASERRALEAYDALEPRCRARLLHHSQAPEIAAAFLSDPRRRPLTAVRTGAAAYEVCADAFDAAADRHAASGEEAWALWWRAQIRLLPAGVGAGRLLDAARDTDPAVAQWFTAEAAAALIDRVELADFDAVFALSGDPRLIAAVPDYSSDDLALALTLAGMAGRPVRAAPAAWPDETDLIWDFDRAIEDWLDEGLLAAAPGALGVTARACAEAPDLDGYALLETGARPDCGLALYRLKARLPDPDDLHKASTYALAFALFLMRDGRASKADALALAAGADRDAVAEAALFSGDESWTRDVYGCFRPTGSLTALWRAAAPTEESKACAILADQAPDPGDAAALARALPMTECPADAGRRDAMRRVTYAARAGDPAGYACFARIGEAQGQYGRAGYAVLAAIRQGVALGHLSDADWIAAGGPEADPALIDLFAPGWDEAG